MAQSVDSRVKTFFKILNEDLKFEDSSKISSAKIQRLLENPASGPFLSEFIQTVKRENVLTPEQLDAYNKIKTQGRTKSGEELQRALEKHKELCEAYDAQKTELDKKIAKDKLKKQRLEYELAQLKEMKHRLQRLEGNQNMLKESTQKLRDDKNEAASTNEQMSKTINNLDTTFQNLCNIIEKVDGKNYLLSQVDLQDLMKAEEKYNAQLTSFVKKQFFEISKVIAEDLSEQENCHEICSVNDENLFASESEEVRQTVAAAIERAKLGYPDREKKLISVHARESAAESAVSFLHQKRTNLQQNIETTDPNPEQLRKSLEQTVQKSSDVKEEIHKLSNDQIPNLISQGTPLQTTHLLTGDYRRKWVRQQYFMEKQQKVISLLQQQQARLDLLWKLLAVEEAGHEKTGKQIDVVLNELQLMLNESLSETEWFEKNPQDKQNAKTRSVFDENDKVAISTFKILGVEENSAADLDATLYHHFDSLPHAAQNLQRRLNDVRQFGMSSSGTHPDEVALNGLSDTMSTCKSLLGTRSNMYKERGDQENVILTPDAVNEMTNHLQSEFENLSGLVMRCAKEIDQKKNFLQYNKRAAEAQTMWINFHLNPSKLPRLNDGGTS